MKKPDWRKQGQQHESSPGLVRGNCTTQTEKQQTHTKQQGKKKKNNKKQPKKKTKETPYQGERKEKNRKRFAIERNPTKPGASHIEVTTKGEGARKNRTTISPRTSTAYKGCKRGN